MLCFITIKSVSCRSRIPNKIKGWSGSWISILQTKLLHFISALTVIQHLKERHEDEIMLCDVLHHMFRGFSKASRQKLHTYWVGDIAAGQGHWKHQLSKSYSRCVQSLMGAHWSKVLSPHCSILSPNQRTEGKFSIPQKQHSKVHNIYSKRSESGYLYTYYLSN